MFIQTSRLGEVSYEDEDIILFKHGLPGFKELKKYKLIEVAESPFLYLQSLDSGDLSFIVVSPFDFFMHYEFDIPEYLLEEMEINDQSQLKIVNIVTIRNKLADATINLAAPVIINNINRTGTQLILPDGTYRVNQQLFSNNNDK